MEQRYRRMEDQEPYSDLALNQDFAKGRWLKPKVKKLKTSKLGDVLIKVM